jgi:putative ABC transport system permease protein
MVMGVVAVVLTSVAGVVAHDVFVAREEQRSSRATTYAAEVTFTHPMPDSERVLAQLISERLRGQPADFVITAQVSAHLVATLDPGLADSTATKPVDLVLYDGEYTKVRRLPLLSGRWPAGRLYPPSAVVNQAAAREAGSGGVVSLTGSGTRPRTSLRISGVIADGEQSPLIYIPWETARTLLPDTSGQGRVRVLVHASGGVAVTQALIDSVSSPAEFAAERVYRHDSVPSVEEQLSYLQMIFAIVAAIALTVSALGIVNLGLATVAHRARELSIRRAVGARRIDLFALVLGSSLVTGLFAALIGIGLVALGIEVILPGYIPPDSAIAAPNLPWSAVALGCLAACGTAVLGSTLPAIRASRVDIASVLRD